MSGNKPAMRRNILLHLFEHLKDRYDIELPSSILTTGAIQDREIDALLAFKSDAKLDELRGALTRLENDTFGTCIGCKGQLSKALLESDPTTRLCPECEDNIAHNGAEGFATHTHMW